jgi:excisionase family DNA binding protein
VADLLKQLAKEIYEIIKLEGDFPNKIMDSNQCAEYLHTNPSEIRRLAKAGEIPHVQLGGKGSRLRFNRDAIDRWMGV